MIKLSIQAITGEYGCCVYTELNLKEDYTMNQVIQEVKRLGYKAFRIIETGMKFVEIA